MQLRDYRPADADIICGWITNETALYEWSADRYGTYPLTPAAIEANYAPLRGSRRFLPLTAVEENGDVLGHILIRYPNEDDDRTVRFGFVIVDPAQRGKGLGSTMLRLAVTYARDVLHARYIGLGVFEQNAAARRCYEAVGFAETGREAYPLPVGVWTCIEMGLSL